MAKVCYSATFGSWSCDKIFGCKHSILKLLVSGTGSAYLLLQTGLTVCLTLPLIFGIKLTQMEWSKNEDTLTQLSRIKLTKVPTYLIIMVLSRR